MILRAKIIKKFVDELKPDLIIGESQIDSLLFSYNLRMKTFFDCPTPLADEEFFGDQLTKIEYTHFLKQELNIYSNVDYLSFHWQSYGEYVRGGNYNYKKNNIIKFNVGCDIKEKRAQYSKTPRIVYLGYLGGYYIDLELLARLSKVYPYIDVYGSPPPNKLLGLNYIGYANPDVVADYQFGLITITKDPLRRKGFSAKHLEYLSYGLPVLVPDWRENLDLIDGSIPYNETNFLDKISEYSNRKSWLDMQKRAITQAKKLSWNETLKPLDNIIKSL